MQRSKAVEYINYFWYTLKNHEKYFHSTCCGVYLFSKIEQDRLGYNPLPVRTFKKRHEKHLCRSRNSEAK